MCILFGKGDEGNGLLMLEPLIKLFWIVKLENPDKVSRHVRNRMKNTWFNYYLVLV